MPPRFHARPGAHPASRALGALAVGVTLAAAACSDSPTAPSAADDPFARVQAATSAYRDVNAATADGFVQAGPCVSAPGMGAMGFHYVNGSRMGLAPDVERPQALLYVPEAGRLQLVGVEYIAAVLQDGQPYRGESPPANPQPAPRLFDRAFDGPSPPRSPGAPWQYELHAWVWRDNPAGRFAPFNAALSC